MKQYLGLLHKVLTHGEERLDRTGTGTVQLFGEQLKFDLREGFPLVTTKKMFMKGVIAELLWFLTGDTDVKTLQSQGVHIWDAWENTFGTNNPDLGRIYGAQWRYWRYVDHRGNPGTLDQISKLVGDLKQDPFSRRHIVTAWNPGELDQMALPPCHRSFQCNVSMDGHLDLQVDIRSNDLFLGAPFNIASYALLTMMLAQQVKLKPRMLTVNIGDAHIYLNHVGQVEEQLRRWPYPLPAMTVRKRDSIFKYTLEDFELQGYQHHPKLTGEISV
jgi:thymidylate synthase